MKEKLGIVVPVYNVEDYLECCIESIIHQTYDNWELVLVDDGSTDESSCICDRYAMQDDRISVLHFKENKGPIQARYEGVKYVDAKYITFVDSDDWLEKSILKKMMNAMLSYDVDMVSTGTSIEYWSEEEYKKMCDSLEEGKYLKCDIQSKIVPIMLWEEKKDGFGMEPSLWMKIFKRDLLLNQYNKLKNKIFHYAEDVAIVYPYVLEADTIFILHEYGYYHRARPRGVVFPYVLADSFYRGLFCLYEYLEKCFKNCEEHEILMKQLNLFYINAVNLKKLVYKKDSTQISYLFPFQKVKKDSSIVLYGAGNIGRVYYNQIKKILYCKDVLWVDKNNVLYADENIKSIEEIFSYNYDYIVIAIQSKEMNDTIVQSLLDRGVETLKIVRYCE